MPSSHSSHPRMMRLLLSWFRLSGWIAQTFAIKAREITDRVPDFIKDVILDTERTPLEKLPAEKNLEVQPLPMMDPAQLAVKLRDKTEQALQEAAAIINEDPSGLLETVTEERVFVVFRELAEETLQCASELRVAEAEKQLRCSKGEWAKKLHRMLAEEGRWPPTQLMRRKAGGESQHDVSVSIQAAD